MDPIRELRLARNLRSALSVDRSQLDGSSKASEAELTALASTPENPELTLSTPPAI